LDWHIFVAIALAARMEITLDLPLQC